jgi:hypothetical protein
VANYLYVWSENVLIMKILTHKQILPYFAITLLAIHSSCDTLNHTLNTTAGVLTGNENKLTNDEVIAGLKEALTVGTNNSAALASAVDGFYKNPRLFIPFPPEAQKVKEKAEQLGMNAQVDKFVMTLNRGAEEACKEAAPVFIGAIKGMSISDGFNILNGPENAATKYLEEKTSGELYSTFKPKVKTALEKVELTKYWNPIITRYNQVVTLTGGEKMNPDLDDYATKGAIKGLFVLIADEEQKIRKDPVARVSDILKKVFGSLDKQ